MSPSLRTYQGQVTRRRRASQGRGGGRVKEDMRLQKKDGEALFFAPEDNPYIISVVI